MFGYILTGFICYVLGIITWYWHDRKIINAKQEFDQAVILENERIIRENEDLVHYKQHLENDIFEPTKPNLPIIEGDSIAFRNSDNEVIKIKDDKYGYISSLYKAILKHSTKVQPNIVDTEKFYMDVEKNFSKRAFSDSPAINSALESGYIAISNMFDRLYRVVTDDRSQEGKTITVEEYTNMMDTWSSLDYNVPDKSLKDSFKDAFGL